MEPGVTGAWSIKEILAHITTWEEESLIHLPLILAGGKTPRYSVTYGGIDAFNALAVEKMKDWPLAEVLRRQDDTHRRLVEFLMERRRILSSGKPASAAACGWIPMATTQSTPMRSENGGSNGRPTKDKYQRHGYAGRLFLDGGFSIMIRNYAGG